MEYFNQEQLKNIGAKQTKTAMKIYDSYKVRKKDFQFVLNILKERFPESLIFKNRSPFNLKMEWTVHNFFHMINYKTNKTTDVDLNFEMPFLHKLGYNILGILTWLFVK